MYQFSGKLKTFALAFMVIGALGVAYSFYNGSNTTLEDAKEIIANQHDTHGAATVATHASDAHNETKSTEHATDAHANDEHAEHVLHQLQNRPWSAFYVSLCLWLAALAVVKLLHFMCRCFSF